MGHALKVRFNDRRGPDMRLARQRDRGTHAAEHAKLIRAFSAKPLIILILGLRPRLS